MTTTPAPAEYTVRECCGTRFGIRFHQAAAELLCPACIQADIEWIDRTHRHLPPGGMPRIRESIRRCTGCASWTPTSRPCRTCALIDATLATLGSALAASA